MYKSNVFVPIMQGKGTKMLPNYVFFNNVEDCWRGHKKAPKIFVLGAFLYKDSLKHWLYQPSYDDNINIK